MLIFLQFSIRTRAAVTSSRHRPFCFKKIFLVKLFVLYRATRISVYVIAVSKSHEFLLRVRLSFFSTPTPSRRRVVIFSTTTQGIRLRRWVHVFSTTSDTSFQYSYSAVKWLTVSMSVDVTSDALHVCALSFRVNIHVAGLLFKCRQHLLQHCLYWRHVGNAHTKLLTLEQIIRTCSIYN